MFCFSSSFIVINSIVIYLVRSRDHSAQRKTNDEVKYNKKTNKLRKNESKSDRYYTYHHYIHKQKSKRISCNEWRRP